MNGLMSMDDITKALSLAAVTSQRISEQMGIVNSRIDATEAKIDKIIERQDAVDRRMENYEDRVRVTRSQRKMIKDAVRARVNYLLGIKNVGGVISLDCMPDEKRYRGAFLKRCYLDAKRESRLGDIIEDTLARDLEEVIAYVGTWIPNVAFEGKIGVEGYKAYLDTRKEIKG